MGVGGPTEDHPGGTRRRAEGPTLPRPATRRVPWVRRWDQAVRPLILILIGPPTPPRRKPPQTPTLQPAAPPAPPGRDAPSARRPGRGTRASRAPAPRRREDGGDP